MENDQPILVFDGDFSFIPNRIEKIGIADARKHTFGAEGNKDFLAEAFCLIQFAVKAAVAFINFEFPCSVEIDPAVSLKLRIGVFASWNYHGGFSCILFIYAAF